MKRGTIIKLESVICNQKHDILKNQHELKEIPAKTAYYLELQIKICTFALAKEELDNMRLIQKIARINSKNCAD